MVKVVFYEKPGCANNARQKAMLAASGHVLEVRDILRWPWTADTLASFFGDRPVVDWFNRAAPRVKSGALRPQGLSKDAALALMLGDPLLIRRPLMEALGHRDAGFDVERVGSWIGLAEHHPPPPEACTRDAAAPCPAPAAAEFRLAAAAVLRAPGRDVDDLLARFAKELREQGVAVRGVVQRKTPDPAGGHAQMDLIDVETGDRYCISQKLGRGASSCHLDPAGLTAASAVLRRAIADRPALIIANRFSEQEATGRGFADELLSAMAEGIPVLTSVGVPWQEQWLGFSGGSALLPPSLPAVRRWFATIGAAADHRRGGVLAETVAALSSILGEELDRLTVERAVIGPFFTAVKLNNGAGGACHTPQRPLIRSDGCAALPKSVQRAGQLKGRPASAFLVDLWEDQDHCRALGIAVINALADTVWRRQPAPGWRMETGVDALSAAALCPDETLVMVGAFVSYIGALKGRHAKFSVLELTDAPFLPDELTYYRPAVEAPEEVPTADVLLMTGSTLVNDTIDDLLALARPDARVLVVGPSVPLLPEVLAAKGADILATIRITDADRFLDALAEGGGAHGAYGGGAELVVLSKQT